MKIEDIPFEITGRLIKTIQMPATQEDYFDIEDPERLIRTFKKLKPRPDIFCFWQRLPEVKPKYSHHLEWDNVAAIPVTTYDRWYKESVHSGVRTKLRKSARRGVVTRVVDSDDKLIEGIAEIFNETPIRRGRPYEQFGKTRQDVCKEWSIDLDKSAFIGAYLEDELIGFMKITFTERYAELSGTVSKLKYRDKSPMNALIAECVRFCESKHIPYLTYGRLSYGKKGEDSLSDFKRHNGFQKIELPRYYVPLTWKGRIVIFLRLYRGVNLLPRRTVWVLKAAYNWWQRRCIARGNMSSWPRPVKIDSEATSVRR